MISRGFIKSSIIYTIAGALPMASAIILLPFYIYHLPTDLYGALSVYMAFTLLVQIVVTFSFDASMYIHFHELKNDLQKLSGFISSTFVCIICIGICIGLFLALFGDLLFHILLSQQDISFYPFGVAAVGSGILQAIFKVNNSLLQSKEQPVTFFWTNIASFSLIALFTIGGLQIFPNALYGPIFGRLLAVALTSGWVLVSIFKKYGFHFRFTWLTQSFTFNLYTFLYQLQQWVINYFDRFILFLFVALQDVGVYDFAVKCLIPVELLMQGMHNAFYPKVISAVISQQEKGSTPEINRYYHGLIAVTMLVTCASILVLPWAIETFVTKSSYQASIRYVPYLAILYFFRSARTFFVVPYMILKYTKRLSVIYFVISVIKIGLMFLLIKELQVYGVIVASLLCILLELWLLRRFIEGKFRLRYNYFKIIIAPALLGLFILLSELSPWTQPHVKHFLYIIICLVLLLWLYRNEIRSLNLLLFRKS